MNLLHALPHTNWTPNVISSSGVLNTQALERSLVIYLPQLRFKLMDSEKAFLTPLAVEGKAKNISFNPHTGRLKHCSLRGPERFALSQAMARYARDTHSLIISLCSTYIGHLRLGMTSFRPIEIRDRPSSQRKDDHLLHIDAFPSRPTGGDRILRVFSNIHPESQPRAWRLGLIPFEEWAQKFVPQIAPPSRLGAWLLDGLGLTQGRRSAYDHCMLQLHNLCKASIQYQAHCPTQAVNFPAGTTWLAFTDSTTHAVVSGQYLMEQTFYLPASAMLDSSLSPLHVLQRLTDIPLVA